MVATGELQRALDDGTDWTAVKPGVVFAFPETPHNKSRIDHLNSQFKTAIKASGDEYDWTGTKFAGGYSDPAGFGRVRIANMRVLRSRSLELFQTQAYCRGIVRRLYMAEIHTGLSPECRPVASMLDMDLDQAADWADDVEVRWHLWADASPSVCDRSRVLSFGKMQQQVRMLAIVGGDVLAVLVPDAITRRPTVQLITSEKIVTPFQMLGKADIRDGVEIDKHGHPIAYHVLSDDGTVKRIAASVGGQRQAWLIFGDHVLPGATRCEPLLAMMMQSMAQLDRYRDSTQLKATINSQIAIFMQKDLPTVGSGALANAAIGNGSMVGASDGMVEGREHPISTWNPGIAIEDLAPGEKPVAFKSDGTDLNFPAFEETITDLMAWHVNIPPELLRLKFGSNYAASQAALNEFATYNDAARKDLADQFLRVLFREWMIAEVRDGAISAPGFLAAALDPSQYALAGAWLLADWTGLVKPTADPVKSMKAAALALEMGTTSRRKIAKRSGEGRWSHVVREIKRENEQFADAMAPLWEAQARMKSMAIPHAERLDHEHGDGDGSSGDDDDEKDEKK